MTAQAEGAFLPTEQALSWGNHVQMMMDVSQLLESDWGYIIFFRNLGLGPLPHPLNIYGGCTTKRSLKFYWMYLLVHVMYIIPVLSFFFSFFFVGRFILDEGGRMVLAFGIKKRSLLVQSAEMMLLVCLAMVGILGKNYCFVWCVCAWWGWGGKLFWLSVGMEQVCNKCTSLKERGNGGRSFIVFVHRC